MIDFLELTDPTVFTGVTVERFPQINVIIGDDGTGTIHTNLIVTDHDWKVPLGRGLDTFQHCKTKDPSTLANRLQQLPAVQDIQIDVY